ncbi:MAG: hypothetical protein ACK55I_20955, partial [bacterium]
NSDVSAISVIDAGLSSPICRSEFPIARGSLCSAPAMVCPHVNTDSAYGFNHSRGMSRNCLTHRRCVCHMIIHGCTDRSAELHDFISDDPKHLTRVLI